MPGARFLLLAALCAAARAISPCAFVREDGVQRVACEHVTAEAEGADDVVDAPLRVLHDCRAAGPAAAEPFVALFLPSSVRLHCSHADQVRAAARAGARAAVLVAESVSQQPAAPLTAVSVRPADAQPLLEALLDPSAPVGMRVVARRPYAAARAVHEQAIADAEAQLAAAGASAAARLEVALVTGNRLLAVGDGDEALPWFRRALEIDAGCTEARYQVLAQARDARGLAAAGQELHSQGNTPEAIVFLEAALNEDPDLPGALFNLAQAYQKSNRPEMAAPLLARARELQPGTMARLEETQGVLESVQARMDAGEYASAYAEVVQVMSAGGDQARSEATMALWAQLAPRFEDPERVLQQLKLQVMGGDHPELRTVGMLAAAARLADELGDADAWDLAVAANAPVAVSDDHAAGLVDAAFATAFALAALRLDPVPVPAPAPGSARPCFVVGLPRTGTTLLEQILASHPRVHGAGELPHFGAQFRALREEFYTGAVRVEECAPRCPPEWVHRVPADAWARAAAEYRARLPVPGGAVDVVVDKNVYNFKYLPLLHALFPDAAIVVARRDPCDQVVSMFLQDFEQRVGLNQLAARIPQLVDLSLAHDEILGMFAGVPALEVRYEDVVADLEGQARRLLAHVGLDWDPAVLRFFESDRVVTTASREQVRRPIYGSSVGRWRRYHERMPDSLRGLCRG